MASWHLLNTMGVPHTGGGDPELYKVNLRKYGVFPTQVGVILKSLTSVKKAEGVPHTGGGDPQINEIAIASRTCSPHRWG